jgi:hypothetical protein
VPTPQRGDLGRPKLRLFGVFGEEHLGGDEAFAEFEVGKGEFGFVDDLFEGAEDGDGVHVVEEADVGDAEELAWVRQTWVEAIG